MNKGLKEKIKNIPHKPGCYHYFDKTGRLIYIGKAKDLKKRVYSYFVGLNDPKTTVLVENISDIKWEITESEIEALVLESILIKKFKPKFNIKIKDDKDFLWIKIDFRKKFPFPELVRKPQLESKVRIFGPFTDSRILKEGLSVLRKIFLWRDCSESKFSFYNRKGKPCLEYYIKNCDAPCCGFVNNNDYQLDIKQLILFLKGSKKKIITEFEKKMKTFSKKKEFEKAALYRDKLKSLKNIDANLKINKIEINNQLRDLESFIDQINLDLGYGLKQKRDFRIEFYDISNIGGSEAVGSMIVWQGGDFARNQYRKFKVRTVTGPNDVKMLREVLSRRVRKISNFQFSISNQFSMTNDQKKDASFSNKPDLIMLDGGKPQLGEIFRLFGQLGVDIPLVSLAKREEEVFGIKGGQFKKTTIEKKSPEGFFIQRLRDEAHRFAIGYHKKLRSKKITRSKLDEIEGIGPKLKKKLLLKFSSISGIMRANFNEIEKIVGKKLARKIKENL